MARPRKYPLSENPVSQVPVHQSPLPDVDYGESHKEKDEAVTKEFSVSEELPKTIYIIPNDWQSMDNAPRNGMRVYLSEKPEGSGQLCIWKKTRAFANATHRWEESGKWVDAIMHTNILFRPRFWKLGTNG